MHKKKLKDRSSSGLRMRLANNANSRKLESNNSARQSVLPANSRDKSVWSKNAFKKNCVSSKKRSG